MVKTLPLTDIFPSTKKNAKSHKTLENRSQKLDQSQIFMETPIEMKTFGRFKAYSG